MGAWGDSDVLEVGETSGVTPGHWDASSLGTRLGLPLSHRTHMATLALVPGWRSIEQWQQGLPHFPTPW